MKYGLIGEKLSHSFSAEIHKQLFDYDYELKELQPSEVEDFLRERDFAAINVTIPYKETVVPYLDVVDGVARQIGSVNTVVNRDGKLYGYNTDFDGLCALVRRVGVDPQGKKVLILGSGGTSKTAVAVAHSLGCGEVLRVSRTARDGCISYEQAKVEHNDTRIIINTTPCGMYPRTDECPISLTDFPQVEGVVDVVYNPLRTVLICDALKNGIAAVGGLYMLVAQAAFAAEKFVGLPVSAERIEAIYRRMKEDKENIVLIGMPASGKTTVGRLLADLLDRPFLDTDAYVEKEKGCSIPTLFAEIGESGFRDCEVEAIREIAATQGAVIATGGGAMLRPENVMRLKRNGRLYFLDRSLSLLSATADRPLSSNREDLMRRYEERYPIYSAVCDAHMDANGTAESVSNLIREDFLYEHFGD